MLPMRAVRLQLGELLAADTTTLAPVAANKIALIAAPFTPDQDLTVGDLTLATFTGSAPKAGVAGAQTVGNDPVTQEQMVNIIPPAGGYIFICTVAPASPETIYGFALIDDAGTGLLAVETLNEPVTISDVNDQVDLGNPDMRFVAQPIS